MEGMKEIVLALVDIFFVLQDWIFDWVITCLFAQTGHVKWAIAAAAIITLPGLAIMVGMMFEDKGTRSRSELAWRVLTVLAYPSMVAKT